MKAFSSKEFLGIMDMILFDEDIPSNVKKDVSKRVHDWLSVEGHSETDSYIAAQYQYLLRVTESINKNASINR